MQFIDLKTQQERIRNIVEEKLMAVLDHGRYVMGPEITELEARLAEYCGVKHALGVASGTDALLIALMAYEVGPGDAVFTTPFTFIATAEVINLLGATPVFVDIEEDSYNIDPVKLEEAVVKVKNEGKLKPKGIIPVDIFGQMAEYDEIEEIGRKYEMFVLEDAAQSFGASYKGTKAGCRGDVAATSFFPAKPLGAYGDGGMIFTDNSDLHHKMTSIRVHGFGENKYDNVRVGVTGRLDSMQAAVLLAKMDIFDDEMALRQDKAEVYAKLLDDHYTAPAVKEYNVSAWAQYSILCNNRDEVVKKLGEAKLPVAVYYPIPLHLQTVFAYLGYKKGDFPVTESIADRVFSVPFHPYLETRDQETICSTLNSFSKGLI